MRLINNSFGLGQRLQAFPLTLSRGITEPNISEREIIMKQFVEQFKPVIGYEGRYEISNYGRVKSLARKWKSGYDTLRKKPETILKDGLNSHGYYQVILHKDHKANAFKIHHLVWDHFGNAKRNGQILQVDHKDENKQNNRIDNLQLLTNQENCLKYRKTQKYLSNHIGIHKHKDANSWIARIMVNGKRKYLGCFKNEYDAHLAYKKELEKVI